jgi:UDP-galactopyranose mutase
MPMSGDVLCLSHLRWGFVYQRPNHLMARCARERRVFFVEEPIFDAETPHVDVQMLEGGLNVVVPHLRAGTPHDAAEKTQRVLLERLVDRARVRDPLLWFYTPMALGYARGLPASAVVYDCMDELSHFHGAPPMLVHRERQLFSLADVVFTGGHSLWEAKRAHHPSVHAFPSSVDAAHFAKARGDVPEPADQRRVPRPRLGYFGVIDERMDLDLVADVADARRDLHVVMVGPVVKIDPASLPRRPNIHWLGPKKYAELPAYIAGWDVAIMPFARNDATKFISPTKTLEYLAAGKPVVSTSIRDVVSPYGERGLVRIADEAPAFVAAATAALAERGTEEQRRHRRACDAFVAQTSWDTTWQRMSRLVAEVLARRAREAARPARRGGAVFDHLIVGAGFAGSVCAERLASMGRKVIVCDKRNHVGGNAFDHYDDAGLLVHKYGPHIFHTASRRIFDYLSRFTLWRPYEHRVLACVDGKLLPFPINIDTVNRLYGLDLDESTIQAFFDARAERIGHPKTSEEAVVSKVGRELYEKFFRSYTRKQWGLDPSELDAAVASRVPARTNRDDRYFTDEFQAMPLHGYTRMFERMLDHPNIRIVLNTDYRDIVDEIRFREMIYTGPIDGFFDHRYGKLPYRSLDFAFETLDEEVFQPGAVVNYPNEHAYTRITEFKYLTGQRHPKTSIVYELPKDEGDPYYPVPRPQNAELYRKYKALADETPNVHFVGRLATYKYYNMDQVVGQALALIDRITGAAESPPSKRAA